MSKIDSEGAPAGGLEDCTQFNYLTLNPDVNEIRLVTISPPSPTHEVDIECCLSHTPLHEAPAYEALSYTWADEDGDSSLSSKIILDGFPFLVTRNLEAALRQLRLPSGERIFWIDAICIDQKNDAERSHQVAMMKIIYEKADEVAIWLGIEGDNSGLGFDFLHGALERADAEAWTQNILTDPTLGDFLLALDSLYLRPYWDRIWIVQEVFSARKSMVYCGSNSISWTRLIKAADFIQQQIKSIGASRLTSPTTSRVMASEGPNVLEVPWDIDTKRLPDLFEMLLRFRDSVSADPRDKVYGIVGLTAARHDGFTVDYSRTVSEVYRDVVHYVVRKSESLQIISVPKAKCHPDWLPSWAPDWSQGSGGFSFSFDYNDFDAALGNPVEATFDSTGRVLRVQGMSIAIIESVAMPLNYLRGGFSFENYNFYHLLYSICSWHELAKEAEGGEAYRGKAFQDVICMRPYADHELDNEGSHILENSAAAIEQYMPKHPLDGMLHDALRRWQNKVREQDRTVMVNQACHDLDAATCWFNGRRFFLSSSGQMGVAPHIAEVGDIICILFGSPCPVILRPHDGYHTVIGDAYVYGLMYGEAMEGLSDGKYTTQEFELH
jgi:hypothetical protein